jgi:hypothetical protein
MTTLLDKTLLQAIAAVFFAGAIFGQASDSIIGGVVKDSAGAVVPGAKITAVNKNTNVQFTSVTNSAGECRLNNIPVGRYDISGTAAGFAAQTITNVQTDLNLTLQVSSVSSTVEVIDSPAEIDTSTAQVQTTFDSSKPSTCHRPGSPKRLMELEFTTLVFWAQVWLPRVVWGTEQGPALPAKGPRTMPSMSTECRIIALIARDPKFTPRTKRFLNSMFSRISSAPSSAEPPGESSTWL